MKIATFNIQLTLFEKFLYKMQDNIFLEVYVENGDRFNMKKLVIGIALVAVVAVGGYLAYFQIIGSNDDPSEEVAVPTLVADESGNQVVYRIDKEQSEVSFTLQEDLRGVRTTVVGVTNEVAGDILVDFNNPSQSTLSMVRVNVRTLETDSSMRNNQIRGQILQSSRDEENYEFADFTPTEIVNFPADPQVGESVNFQIVGEFRVRDIVQTITFDATVTLVDENTMTGTATTQVLRSDYELTIPSVPSVANVTDEVQLQINFVAVAVDDSVANTEETSES